MRIFFVFIFGATAAVAAAQSLPPTSRTVYKCEVGGKTHYSDAPCLGAKKVDVEPTRGMNKSTGKELIGKDVRREQHEEEFANAVRPLTGKNKDDLYKAGRRANLTPEQQRLCIRLDASIPEAEAAERKAATVEQLQLAQKRLLGLRTAYRDTRCE